MKHLDIKIKRCGDCPYLDAYRYADNYYCWHGGKSSSIIIGLDYAKEKVHPLCPLPDMKEENGEDTL